MAVGDPRGYYRALGVDRTASAEDIRTAFRLRAKELHPDRAGETGDREAFRRLREAYEALQACYETDGSASQARRAPPMRAFIWPLPRPATMPCCCTPFAACSTCSSTTW